MSAIETALARACAWLDGWRTERRGITIGADGAVFAWWLPDAPLEAEPRQLLDQIERDAPLKVAIRTVVHAEAIARAPTAKAGGTVQ